MTDEITTALTPARAATLDRHAFEPRSFSDVMQAAEVFFASGLVPRAIRDLGPERGRAATAAIIIQGRELGLDCWSSLRSIHIIDGQTSLSAALLKARCLATGDVLKWELTESADAATVIVQRRGHAPQSYAYTMADATAAGLAGKRNWKAHRKAMLRNRVNAAAARDCFPDVVANVYTPEEISDGAVLDVESTPVFDAAQPAADSDEWGRREQAVREALGEPMVALIVDLSTLSDVARKHAIKYLETWTEVCDEVGDQRSLEAFDELKKAKSKDERRAVLATLQAELRERDS